ncbi:hypothetical protein LJB42_000725 [Komagataella kurtzmanii]|nr:hypothetical protein LJB42_000725 [Komagataella kurtzmanii]
MSRAISSTKVVIDEQVIPATIIFSLHNGKIIEIINEVLSPTDPLLQAYNVLPSDYRNLTPLVILPGLVDAHVHLNEPGRTEWEGFATGTQSAASGGVTTVVDMPLNAIPPTTTVLNLNLKIAAAQGQCWCDVGFWGGLVPDNIEDLVPLVHAGVRGFKGFLLDSGVEEFPAITIGYIENAMEKVSGLHTILMFHDEMQPCASISSPKGADRIQNVDSVTGDSDSSSVSLESGFSSGTKLTTPASTNVSNTPKSCSDLLHDDIEKLDLGMSQSFIKRAPAPVKDLLRKAVQPSAEEEDHSHCKLPHVHARSINHSVLTDSQAKALAKSPYLASSEPIYGRAARLAKSPELKPFTNEYYQERERELELERKARHGQFVIYDEDSDEYNAKSPLEIAAVEDSVLETVDSRAYASFLASRPDSFETTAIGEIIACAQKNPTVPLHIVHLATHEAVPLLRAAIEDGLKITAETCFHYLMFAAENIPDGHTEFKCCPPIRTESNRQLLWQALRKNVITTVVSDHSPCTPDLKDLGNGDFFAAWGGIASVGLGLPILWTEGRKLDEPISFTEIAKWTSLNTAKQAGLHHRKGRIAVGYDADFAVFDPDIEYTVETAKTFFKNKLTAYNGVNFSGRVVETILRGNSVYALGKGVSTIPMGDLLLEPRFH